MDRYDPYTDKFIRDTISRQAAISHVDDVPYIKDHPNVGLLWKAWIESLPSAQPEKRTQERTETHSCDLISRQAAIDALKGMAVPLYKDPACEDIWERDRTLDNAIDAIRGLPSAQPEQRWIPVSERMPEPRVDVWCNSDMGQMVGYYDEYAETWYGRDYLELIVTAWMPLPEPYRGERTEE